MAISLQSAKNKARKLQQWVCTTILKHFTQLTNDDVRSTSMGANGEDVQLSAAARAALGIQIECKAYKSFAIYRHYEQAQTHGNNRPVLVIKEDRKKPLAVIDAEWLFELMKKQ
jgi:hypothetical protein